MSQKYIPRAAPAASADISPEWIAQVRAIIERDGHAVRAAEAEFTIEVQNINQPEIWQPLNLQTNTHHFTTAQDRDAVLKLLVGRAS